MKTISKQSAGWGIDSKHNLFLYARLKLTALYVLIIAVIITIFSFFLYYNIVSNLSENQDGEFVGSQSQQRYIQRASQNVESSLILADLSVLILAALLSYRLAGNTLRPIQRSMEIQKRFAVDASHELRTPLAIMKTDCEVALRSPDLRPESRLILESNLEEINRMAEMVDNLLLLARSDNKINQTSFEQINLPDFVRSIVERLKHIAHSKKINLSFASDGEGVDQNNNKLFILGNKQLLDRVFINILQNSFVHTEPPGSIFVEVKKKNATGEVTIRDTGEGIDEKHLPHIFERFYKGDASRTRSQGGSGLGLSIVKEIIDQHNGEISITSVKGKGTEVKILFQLV